MSQEHRAVDRPIEIVEIVGPSEQGTARPYLCRGEDGLSYYVKGRQTNRHSLLAEWLCGHLGRAFGLNIPPFRQVLVSEGLILECPRDWRDLGEGICFGSEQHALAEWVEPARLQDIPEQEQQDIVLFDWWVQNMDRTVGNTNLLWDSSAKRAIVIDFNNAFDPHFDAKKFMECHVFASQLQSCFANLVIQAQYATRLATALQGWPIACDNLPVEWHWANPEMDVPANFDLAAATHLLERCLNETPWGPT